MMNRTPEIQYFNPNEWHSFEATHSPSIRPYRVPGFTEEYHYSHPNCSHVDYDSRSAIAYFLPNGNVQLYNRAPQWLQTTAGVKNQILDEAKQAGLNPAELRTFCDSIWNSTFSKPPIPSHFNEEPLSKAIEAGKCEYLSYASRIFQLELGDEAESTKRSGAHAGNDSDQMKRLGAIVRLLNERATHLLPCTGEDHTLAMPKMPLTSEG